MNDWFRDPRAENGEVKSREAERAERRNNLKLAHALYLEAAESFASVALAVPLDYPNTRGDLAVAAVACFARALDFERAVELAQQFLAQPDGVSAGGRAELADMEKEYAQRVRPSHFRTKRAPSNRRRREVRSEFLLRKSVA